jgi:hypothetical protein
MPADHAPISGEAVSIVLRKRARAAGLSAERITALSLRAGHATSAAVAGVALDRIAPPNEAQATVALIERYIRPPRRWSTPRAATWGCGRAR